jgi:hypothetical protein
VPRSRNAENGLLDSDPGGPDQLPDAIGNGHGQRSPDHQAGHRRRQPCTTQVGLNAPVNASASSTTTKVTGTRIPAGGNRMATIGRIDPTVNAIADEASSRATPCDRRDAVRDAKC